MHAQASAIASSHLCDRSELPDNVHGTLDEIEMADVFEQWSQGRNNTQRTVCLSEWDAQQFLT